MLNYLTLIFLCQLGGEALAAATGVPVPGPVVGMVLLFVWLTVRGGVAAELDRVTGPLLSNLSLLFVPAGTGIMVHLTLLAGDGIAVSAALFISTVATIAVTGLMMQALTRRNRGGDTDAH